MSNRFRYAVIGVSLVLIFYVVIGGVLGTSTSSNEQTYKDLGVYEEVLSRINSDYVTEPNLQKVTGGAIRGLLEALDPYSTYFTPEQFKATWRIPWRGRQAQAFLCPSGLASRRLSRPAWKPCGQGGHQACRPAGSHRRQTRGILCGSDSAGSLRVHREPASTFGWWTKRIANLRR